MDKHLSDTSKMVFALIGIEDNCEHGYSTFMGCDEAQKFLDSEGIKIIRC